MSARRKRGHGGGHEEGHADERWIVSYADMLTVLMCLFLVLFAMSSIDANKYAQLRDSLATGFGTTPSTNVDSAIGVIVEPQYVGKQGVGFTSAVTDQTSLQQAKKEVATFEAIVAKVNAGLKSQGLQDQVSFQIDQRGLSIKLIGGQAFFAPDRSELLPAALATVETIGPTLLGLPNEISIEGHAASDPAAPTDWDLAASRSTAVLRHLVESDGVDATKISAVSFGSARPVPGDYAVQRRVDIVVLSDLPEAAKAPIPKVVASPSG